MQTTTPNPTNPKKIPQAVFIENVEEYMVKFGYEKIMDTLQETYGKYKIMEKQIQKSKLTMVSKIPEIQKAIDIISCFEKKREDDLSVDFLLTDTIWAKGRVDKCVEKVSLWLGANTLVEFPLNEAKTLLKKNLENAQGNLKTFEEDLLFLKDQITTCEVNIARIYNQNLKATQDKQAKELEKK